MSAVLNMKYSAVGPTLGVMRCDALFSAWKKWSVLLLVSFNSERLSCAQDLVPLVRDIEAARRHTRTLWQYGNQGKRCSSTTPASLADNQ